MNYYYREYQFYRGQWYPVNKPLNIPKCNRTQLYPRKYIDSKEVVGFYLFYNNKDQLIESTKDSVIMRRPSDQSFICKSECTGSLYIHTPESLIDISATDVLSSIWAHLAIDVIAKVSSQVPDNCEYVNEVFRNPSNSIDECRSVRILPWLARKSDYCKNSIMSFEIPNGIEEEIVLTQKILSVSMNGDDYPFHIFTDKNWVELIDPLLFYEPEVVKPIPSEMLI